MNTQLQTPNRYNTAAAFVPAADPATLTRTDRPGHAPILDGQGAAPFAEPPTPPVTGRIGVVSSAEDRSKAAVRIGYAFALPLGLLLAFLTMAVRQVPFFSIAVALAAFGGATLSILVAYVWTTAVSADMAALLFTTGVLGQWMAWGRQARKHERDRHALRMARERHELQRQMMADRLEVEAVQRRLGVDAVQRLEVDR